MLKADLIYWWLLAINLSTVYAYYYDKKKARYGGWRVSEKQLFGMALLGGSPAALVSAKIFRHKNKKYSFRLVMWVIVLVQLTALIIWADNT